MLFAFFYLFVIGCNDTMLAKVIESKPEIVVHPQELFFGHIESGHESGQETFSIINTGNATLYVEPILMDGSTRYDIPEFLLSQWMEHLLPLFQSRAYLSQPQLKRRPGHLTVLQLPTLSKYYCCCHW